MPESTLGGLEINPFQDEHCRGGSPQIVESEPVQSCLSTGWHPDPVPPVCVPKRPPVWRDENEFVGVGACDSSTPQLCLKGAQTHS